MNVHPANLSNWELGAAGPRPASVARVLGFLGVKGREYEQIMALAEHVGDANWVDQSASPFIDLLSAYERLSSRIVEWAPFRLPDLIRTPTSDSSEDALPRTERSDQELFHREVRRQVMNDGGRRYVFMVGDQAMRSAGHEPFADSQRAHVDIRVLPTSSLGTPGPFTVFEAGNRPVAVALRHDHSTTYVTDKDLLGSYHRTAKALLRQATVSNRVWAS
ncbi:Scr1 family TA system antitoxin-like transcriptional regulator [Amycolatopsis sp. NPDC101161]|uniref:Scr1 family TA system antitoxin-like transcriptional regulator n=1 Tax=Amycolatopsis sp. NPDC101161 TaxID=3363940 RepID=UPI00381AF8A7